MEGISHEAASFAGHLKLGKLIVFYDDNGISIDGKVVGWFTEDTPKRFEAYGWHVVKNVDGHDADAVAAAIKKAQAIARISLRSSAARPSSAGARLTSRAPSPRTARRWARMKWRNARKTLGWDSPPFVDSGRHPRRLGSPRSGRRRREEVAARLAPLQARIPDRRRGVRAPHEGRPAGRLGGDRAVGDCRRRGRHRFAGDARLVAGWRSTCSARRCPRCSAARPTSPAR